MITDTARARSIAAITRDAARVVALYADTGRVADAHRLATSARECADLLADATAPAILPYAYAADDAAEGARRAVLAAR